jgi:hypothetical protein
VTAVALALLVILGTAFAVLRLRFEGAPLGDNIASILNKRMRGRISIGSVEWPTSAIKNVVTGGWVPVTIHDVRVWDDCAPSTQITGTDAQADVRFGDPNVDCTPDDQPDPDPASHKKPRTLLLRTDLITAELDLHAVMFGNHDLVFRHVTVHGGSVLLEQTREPYPLHAYDRTIVSLVSAFYPRKKPSFGAGIQASQPPPIFDLRDIHLEDIDLSINWQPYALKNDRQGYAFTARVEHVSSQGDDTYLYMDARDPLVGKFYVHLAVTSPHATVRVLDEGPRSSFRLPGEVYPPKDRKAEYQVALSDVKLDRLAQLPTEWPRHDFIANTLELDLSAKTVPCSPGGDQDLAAGAQIHLAGELFNYWDRPYDGAWNLKLDGKNLGPTIRTCIKSTVGGDHTDGTLALTGPFIASPKLAFDVNGVDFDLPLSKGEDPLRLTLAEVHGAIDLVNEQGYIEKTKALVRNGAEPGEVEVSATFGLKPYYGNAQVEIVKAIDVGRFLPANVARSVGRFLQGRLRAVGDVDEGFELSDFDLALGRDAREKAFRVHKGRLFTSDAFDTIRIDKVAVDAGRSHAVFDGVVDVKHDDMHVSVDGDFPDLDVWLKRFDLPALFKSAGGGTIVITGPITKPRVRVNTTLSGVPCLDKLQLTDLLIEGDEVTATKLSSPGLGGELTGSARLRVGGAYPIVERLALHGAKLDASRLCKLGGRVVGTIDALDAEVKSPIVVTPDKTPMDWLALAQVAAHAEKLSIAGQKVSHVGACVNVAPTDEKLLASCKPRPTLFAASEQDCAAGMRDADKGGFCALATASRDDGGRLDIMAVKLPGARSGKAYLPARLAGTISLEDLPLAIIDELRDVPLGKQQDVGGLANLTLHLTGTPAAPQATGALQLLRAWFGGAFLGDAQIALEPGASGKVPGLAFHGQALAGRLSIEGTIGTQAPYPVEIAITGHRIELDPFVDLSAKLGFGDAVQAWASGTLTMKTELMPEKPIEPEAFVELTELEAIVNHRAADGRIVPIAVRAKDQAPGVRAAVSLRLTPSSIELACRDPKAKTGRAECSTVVETPAGDITLDGHATPGNVAITATGNLELAKLRPLLDTQFDYLGGSVRLVATISGTLGPGSHPNIVAAIDLDPDGTYAAHPDDPKAMAGHVVMRPIGSDTLLTAPRGLIKLANGALGFTDVLVQIQDERHTVDTGSLHVGGTIALDGLTPTSWAILLSGALPAKMLQVVAPTFVSQANGLVSIDGDLVISGKGARPRVSGGLVFDATHPFAVIPRGARRELAFKTGTIDITTKDAGEHPLYSFDIADVAGTLDDGRLSGIAGDIQVQNGEVTHARVRLDADNLPFRIPGTLALALTARDVSVELPAEHSQWKVRGSVAVVDGKYSQNFELTDRITALATPSAPTKPFWEEYPALGSADLDVNLEVRRFQVKNNVATIEFVGPLVEITGTPRDPRLAGSIRVVRGDFRIPGTRASFTRTTGSVDFAENQKAGNPRLEVTSDADYRDLSGQQHIITLTITGSLAEPTWDLKTSTGYNKSQTLTLLFLGQNQEQLRRSLGDQSLGADPTRIDPTTNPSQGFADQIVKDLAGDWVSGLLGSSLTKLTGLDVLRFEIGFGSIGLHLEAKILENARLIGDGEQTIRGSTVNGRVELKTSTRFSFRLGYLYKNFYDPAEQDVDDKNATVVYRLLIP